MMIGDKNKVTPEFLDQLADNYYSSEQVEDSWIEDHVQIQAIRKILPYINESDSILEMGFGGGVMTAALIASGVKADLIEGSKVLTERAVEAFPELTVFNSMFEDFEPESPYDVVLCFHVLEHVENVPKLLRHARKWLKPNGKFIAIVPNAESIHRQLAVIMGLQDSIDDLSPRDEKVGHLRVYSLEGLKADFLQAGYEIDSEFGNYIKTLPNSMTLDYSKELLSALCEVDDFPVKFLANIGICALKK